MSRPEELKRPTLFYDRNLPHWLPEGRQVFLTWRLHGPLPLSVLQKLRKDKELKEGKRFVLFDGELDRAAFGPLWLHEQRIAEIVQREILEVAQREWCVTYSFVIMPNHVHLLLDPKFELRKIIQAIKGRSVRACYEVLGSRGLPFWSRNPSITGCDPLHPWPKSKSTLSKIRYLLVWQILLKTGPGRVPTGS
jgi:putative transposase